MIIYADTSFLFSLYIPEQTSAAAAAEMKPVTVCLISEFSTFELANALAARRFRGDLSQDEMDNSLNAFRADIASGLFRPMPLTDATFDRASALAAVHTPRIGCRALDVLHVAIALGLNASVLYTFDQRQARLARAAGLSVRPRRRP